MCWRLVEYVLEFNLYILTYVLEISSAIIFNEVVSFCPLVNAFWSLCFIDRRCILIYIFLPLSRSFHCQASFMYCGKGPCLIKIYFSSTILIESVRKPYSGIVSH